ncbi:MAG TPA: glycosyltransferase [Thermoleophilaceae bacterium]|nr:glycosyltransferase [Thermoleophilaceae bacterium]
MKPDLVVMVNGFPRLSETFVLQELLDLESRGVNLMVIALAQPDEAVQQDGLARLRAPVEYVPALTGARRRLGARASHAALLLQGRERYLAALADIVTSPDYSRARLDQAALVAHRLMRLGRPPLYVHFAHKPGTIGRFAARLAGVPYALSCHAKDIWLTPADELRRKLRDARVVLTCTREGAAELERHAAGATPVRLVHHGTEVPAVRAQRATAPGPPRVLTIGRLVPKKGHDVLIAAAAALRDHGVAVQLRIAGDGPEWPRLQRLVHELELGERVVFLGPLTPDEVRDELATASAFALACRVTPDGDRDGLPNVVLEAMARALPVVSTTLAGVAEAVEDGRSGLLVPPENPEALAEALQRVLRDPAFAAQLGQRAAERIRSSFDRQHTLPHVFATLTEAGLVRPGRPIALEGSGGVRQRAA